MREYLLLLFSVCVNVTGSSVNNRFAKKRGTDPVTASAYNLLVACTGLIVILLSGGAETCSPVTIGLGLIFGMLSGCSIVARTAALSCGPMALTLLIGSCGMLIPTFSGALFWQEKLSGTKLIGVALMVLALICIMGKSETRKVGWKWCILCAISFLCTGFISVMQKVQQHSAYAEERASFLAVAFLVSVCMNGVMFLAAHRENPGIPLRPNPALIGSGVVTGSCNGVINILNLYLSGVIPAVVFFPLVNGGAILLSGLVGTLLFREKCTPRQAIGFLLGLTAILCIGGFFG